MTANSPLTLQANFLEHANGEITVRTDGVSQFEIHGSDFKDAMLKLVRTVNMLKKANQIPSDFDLKAHLKVYFE